MSKRDPCYHWCGGGRDLFTITPVLTPMLPVFPIKPQSLPALLVPSFIMGSSLPNSPRSARPSLLGRTYLGDDGVLKLRIDVRLNASIFHDKKLAENLLDHNLFPWVQRKRRSRSTNKIISNSICQLHRVSVFPNLTLVIYCTLSS